MSSRAPDPTPATSSPAPTVEAERCPVCGAAALADIRCKTICRQCRTIVRSCADL